MTTHSPHRRSLPALRALGLAIALAFCAAPALAQVDSSVYVSGFGYSITTPSGAQAGLQFTDPYQILTATSLMGGGLLGNSVRTTGDQSSYAPATAFAPLSNAYTTYATPGDQTFYLTAFASRSLGPPGSQRNQSTATGLNSGTFSLFDMDTGDAVAGSVTFFIDYILGASKPGGDTIDNFASAFLHFNAMSDDGSSGDDVSAQLMSFDQGAGTKSGEFQVTVTLGADGVGFYTLDGRAESFAAVVPEPQEWALMLAGFVGLGAYVKKRKAARA